MYVCNGKTWYLLSVTPIEMHLNSSNELNNGGFNNVTASNVVPRRWLFCQYFIRLRTILIEITFLR